MVNLQNNELDVSVSLHGAEMQRVRFDGRDCLWNGDPNFWSRHAPVLFPVCGMLKGGQYSLDGRLYSMPKHGFARDLDFVLERQSVDSATFRLDSDEKTQNLFPYDWTLRVSYTLQGAAIRVEYTVENRSDRRMYFSIGAHEAYACPEGVGAYELVFPQKQTLDSLLTRDGLLSGETIPMLRNADTLALRDELFEQDALIFHHVKGRAAKLRNRKTGWFASVEFPGCEYFLVWTKPGAPFVCMEPWCGIADPEDTDGRLSDKKGIQRVESGERFCVSHVVQFGRE